MFRFRKKDAAKPENDIKMSEIVVYIDSSAQIVYQDGFFRSEVQGSAEKINELLANKDVTVKQLTGKDVVSKTDSIFLVTLNSKYTKEVLKELQSLSFVNGAYVKAQAEEPSMDDLE